MCRSLVQRPCTVPSILQAVFNKLNEIAVSFVELSFNGTKYKQTAAVAMCSSLGSALANIFVGFVKSRLFSWAQIPSIYFQYVVDTFSIFKILTNNYPISGRVDRESATEAVDSDSILSQVKPKTIKIGIHSFHAWLSAIKATMRSFRRVW